MTIYNTDRTLTLSELEVKQYVYVCACVSVPASFAVLHSLAGGLGEDDALQLPELQDLQVVDDHTGIRHHIVGQVSWQHLPIWFWSKQNNI